MTKKNEPITLRAFRASIEEGMNVLTSLATKFKSQIFPDSAVPSNSKKHTTNSAKHGLEPNL